MKNLLLKLNREGITLEENKGKLKVHFLQEDISQDLLEEIKENKSSLLALLKRSKFENITAVNSEDSYPLSHSQMRLWMLSQSKDTSIAYNISSSFQLDGINVDHFKKAVLAVIDRHESFRTVFRIDENGKVSQEIFDSANFKFAIDYKDYRSSNSSLTKISSFIKEDSKIPFDLENGPLLRATLIQTSEDNYVFYYCMHHIISDGWSMNVLQRDVLAYYEAFQTKKSVVLPELKIQYKDYASWQIEQLKLEESNYHRDYWLDNLSGDLPLLDLPSYKNRPNVKTHNGFKLSTYISKSSTHVLNEYCRENGGSLYMGLLAVWNVLCYKYTSQKDIITGTPIAGRNHSDLKDQIGFYINTLALRNQIDPRENFNKFFGKVKNNTITSFKHQQYPFDKLVEELDIKRDIGRSAIFDVILALQNANENKSTENIIDHTNEDSIIEHGDCISKLDLELIFQECGDRLLLSLKYNTDIYDSSTVNKLLCHYRELLDALLSSPETSLSEIEYLSESEKDELLFTLNNTKKDYPKDKTVVDLFREQVEKSPNEIAICFEDKEITYKELDERSNQLAHCLVSKYDIDLEDFIGIKLERSEWLVISMLAVLKVGGAYVPIDPNYPIARIEYIIKDSNSKVIIDDAFLNSFSNEDPFPKDSINKEISSGNLSYVIYTSGSTGKPKGVMIEHRSLVNLSFWHKNAYEINQSSKGTLFSGVAFDASVWEIYPYLLFGGTLYPIKKEEIRLDVNKLSSFFKEKGITHAYLPSKVCQSFIEQNIQVDTIILTGGEALKYSKRTNLNIYNNYGPTENTVVTSYYNCKNTCKENIPIGKPMDNSQVYILSENLKLHPVGVIGEICIGGEGLSRGYLNLPELTKEKFVRNPFVKGERLYKTGDLGRFLPDGNLEFIGRIDDQVKIRGHRIELGEIETAILSLDFVFQAVLDVREFSGEKTIIAYVVANSKLDKKLLKAKLKESLPDYMLPSYFIELSSIPLTPNGKVDKKSLPEINENDLVKEEYIAPNTDLEKELVQIWQDVLGVVQVGLRSNFFDLGGHSLKAIQLINKIHKKFEIRPELGQIFSNPILEQQSLLIKNGFKNDFCEIVKIDQSDSYAISDAQRRLWVLSQFKSSSVSYNMPKTLSLDKSYDVELFKRSIESVIDRHEVLRTIFVSTDSDQVRQKILTREELDFEIDHQDFRGLEDELDAVRSYISKDSNTAFDLSCGPLLRVSILETGDQGYIFYYNMHHIISDGWSMNVLERDVLAYYESYQRSEEVSLPSLKIQYKDYASWQLSQLTTPEYQSHRDYWLDVLSGDLPLLNLPSVKPRPSIKTHNGHSLSTYISGSTTGTLKGYCQSEGGSLFMGLLATWNVLCYRYTSQRDIIIGTPVAGRDHSSLEDQIGFYINTLALRNEINQKESFNKIFSKIKSNTIESFKHQQYPFDRLIEELDVSRDVSRNAIFDVMLVLQNTGENASEELSQDDNSNLIVDQGNCNAKFDIEVVFKEVGDRLSVSLKYNTDVYDRSTIEGLLQHFKLLLDGLLSAPNLPIDNVDYLSDDEKEELLTVFNDTNINYSKEKTIIDLFKKQVAESCDNIAIAFGDKEVTYKELDEQSNQLAHYLINKYNANKEDFIGIRLERSEWMVISIFAVLKLGAAYVPIAPDYPSERIKFIESDSNCKAIIDEETLEDFTGKQKLYSKDKILNKVLASNLAYVIYTSGSTGKPKGVLNAHSGLFNRLLWMRDNLKINSDDIIIQKTPYTFDVSVWELLMPFITGCKLVIAKPNGHKDPEYLQNLIKKSKVTIIHFVPSMLGGFIENLNIETCESLKHVICSGEALPSKMVLDFQQKLPWVCIHNLYGPTEAAIDVTSIDLTKVDTNKHGVTIGKPVANTKIHIVDKNLLLQPIGVPGELLIEGVQVAKGYLNRPKLNNEKFIQSPFNKKERAYRTGDLAKWLPNGEIFYIGRIDNQVKIRGNRIELGEIEEVLLSIDFINQATVIIKKVNGNETIVAYVLASKAFDKSSLRRKIALKLPDYMLPSYFVSLDLIPLNSNGKVDRKSLPEVEESDTIKEKYIAPITEEEKALVYVYEEVLKHSSTSVTDSFYNLGGDSIKALKVVSTLKHQGFRLRIEDLLKNPKIEDLARSITRIDNLENNLKYHESKWHLGDDIELSHNQRIYLPKHSQGIFSSYINGYDQKSFEEKFRYFLSKFPTLCVTLKQDGTGVKQKLVSSKEIKLTIDTERVSFFNSKKRIDKLVKQYSSKPFDKFRGELIRVLVISPVFDFKKEKSALIFVFVNHILTDAHTNNILKQQLESFFKISKIETSYYKPHFDFASWQNKFLISDEGIRQRNYWIDSLKNIASSIGENDIQNIHVEYVTQKLTIFDDEFDTLQTIAEKFKIPTNVLFLNIHQKLIKDSYPDHTLFQGVAVTGREQNIEGIETDKIIGVLNNLLPLPCIDINVQSDTEYMNILYSRYLKARTYQQIPYLIICKDLNNKYNKNLEANLGGYLNFQMLQDSILEKTDINTAFEYKKIDRSIGVDLTCVMHKNAIEVSLSCPRSLYETKNHQLSLDIIIAELLQ